MEYILFWMAKPLADLAWLFIIIATLFVAFVVFTIYVIFSEWVQSLFKKNPPVVHKEPENEH